MAEDTRLLKILDLLLRLTEADRLDWQSVGTSEEPRFATSFSDASFVVFSKDHDGVHPFVVELRNERGEVLESIKSKGLSPRARRDLTAEEQAARDESRALNAKFYELYNRARRNAMNVDQFLDDVLAELEIQSQDLGDD